MKHRERSSTLELGGSRSMCCGICYCSKRAKALACLALWLPFVVLALLVIALLVNAALVSELYERQELFPGRLPRLLSLSGRDVRAQAERLAGAVAIQTVSYSPSNISVEELERMNDYIENTYVALHDADFVTYRRINEFSRLYRIAGSQSTKNPFLLSAHYDVVPPGDLRRWSHDPFNAGIVEDAGDGGSFVFGRGAIDHKHAAFGILEALNYMAERDERPLRTFYVALGHDEEVTGKGGAAEISKALKAELDGLNETLDFVLEEGLGVVEEAIKGVERPLAMVAVAEKGYATLELSVDSGSQGHSSKPDAESAVGILARAVGNLEENKQPSQFGTGPERATIQYAAPHASFPFRLVMGNLWFFSGILSLVMSKDPVSDALQRTTTAPTIFQAGFKENVIPASAKAYVNHRIHPTDDIASVIDHDRAVIGDPRVKIHVAEHMSPSAISPSDNGDPAFQIVANSILEVYPKSAIIPTLLIGQTDGKHYEWICNKIYRFTPSYINKHKDGHMYHGFDERISVDDYANVVQFYYRLISNSAFNLEAKLLGSTAGSEDEDDGTVTLFGRKVAIPDIFTSKKDPEESGSSSESADSMVGEVDQGEDENSEDVDAENDNEDDVNEADGGGLTLFGQKINLFGSSNSEKEDSDEGASEEEEKDQDNQ